MDYLLVGVLVEATPSFFFLRRFLNSGTKGRRFESCRAYHFFCNPFNKLAIRC